VVKVLPGSRGEPTLGCTFIGEAVILGDAVTYFGDIIGSIGKDTLWRGRLGETALRFPFDRRGGEGMAGGGEITGEDDNEI
jgi:hypothetical protein